MKNFIHTLNGWQRLFVVITLLIQLPITVVTIANYEEYIDAKNINAKINTLSAQATNTYKARVFDLWDVSNTNYSSISELDTDNSAIPKVENPKEFALKVEEARKEFITDTEILNYLNEQQKIDTTEARKLGLDDTVILNKILAQLRGIFKFKFEVKNQKYQYAAWIVGNGTSEQLKETATNLLKIVEDVYQLNFIKNSLLILSISVLISIFTYTFGWAFGWVYRGFKTNLKG